MHTLVTGGAGFIGSALVERLLAEGHTVDVVDNLSSGSLWNLAEARGSAGRNLSFHQLDVRSPDVADLIVRKRPEVVWHLAALTSVAEGISNPAGQAHTDVVGTLGVLEGMRAAGTRKVVVASSAAVYGEGGTRPLVESHPRRPLSPHGVGKHAIDGYLAVYAQLEAVKFTSLVLASVYGPRAVRGVVAAWADCLVAGRPCTVFGDGSAARDFVYIDDVVDAFARAGTGGDGMVLNVGTGQATSLSELHRLMVEVAGAVIGSEPDSSGERGPALGLRHADRPVGEPHAVVLDPARAAQALGWGAWTALPDGLDAVIRAARDTARRA